jgi:hypothetical protein
MRTIGRVARDHQQALCAALSLKERDQLAGLLVRIADEQGLRPGVHRKTPARHLKYFSRGSQ